MVVKKKAAKKASDLSQVEGIGLAKPDKKRPYRERGNPDRRDALDATVTFRTTRSNADAFTQACEAGGWSKSDYLRMLQEGMQGDEKKPLIVDANLIAYQIRKAGNNINQIAHVLNKAARFSQIDARLAKAAIVHLDAINRSMIESLTAFLED